ncbi:MAG: YigZ family protein [Desulfitobacterium sp.]
MESYDTVLSASAWEQVIEKSRFISLVFPVTNTEEVEQRLQEVRKDYPNARHYVYAYRLYQGQLEKSTDDGEPQGTGGRPILDVLQYRQLWDVLLVVIRYFGGILLGTGGLSRAYGGTARQLMDQASVGRLVPHQIYEIEAGYEWYEPLKYWLKQYSWSTANEEFLALVKFQVYIPWADREQFLDWLTDFTERKVVPREIEVTLCAEHE